MMPNKTLTTLEKASIDDRLNLTDGHCKVVQNWLTDDIVSMLPEMFRVASESEYTEIEKRFIRTLSSCYLGAEEDSLAGWNPFVCYSASSCIEIVANFLAARRFRVGLIEPTFDNIPGILKRNGVELVPINEETFFVDQNFALADDCDAIFIVVPGNPTGRCISPGLVERLFRFCSERGILVVADFSFRAFDEYGPLDHYSLAQSIGGEYIFIEDTGKCLPSLDMKVGVLSSSFPIRAELRAIFDDFLLNVSPFLLLYLDHLIRHMSAQNWQLLKDHCISARRLLMDKLSPLGYTDATQLKSFGLAWLQIPEHEQCADDVCEALGLLGVRVLPGSPFYWNSIGSWDRYIRVALTREHSVLIEAAKKIAEDALGRGPLADRNGVEV